MVFIKRETERQYRDHKGGLHNASGVSLKDIEESLNDQIVAIFFIEVPRPGQSLRVEAENAVLISFRCLGNVKEEFTHDYFLTTEKAFFTLVNSEDLPELKDAVFKLEENEAVNPKVIMDRLGKFLR